MQLLPAAIAAHSNHCVLSAGAAPRAPLPPTVLMGESSDIFFFQVRFIFALSGLEVRQETTQNTHTLAL